MHYTHSFCRSWNCDKNLKSKFIEYTYSCYVCTFYTLFLYKQNVYIFNNRSALLFSVYSCKISILLKCSIKSYGLRRKVYSLTQYEMFLYCVIMVQSKMDFLFIVAHTTHKVDIMLYSCYRTPCFVLVLLFLLLKSFASS